MIMICSSRQILIYTIVLAASSDSGHLVNYQRGTQVSSRGLAETVPCLGLLSVLLSALLAQAVEHVFLSAFSAHSKKNSGFFLYPMKEGHEDHYTHGCEHR